MGSLLHPVGSQGPRVYWTRRVLVVLLAVVLLGGLGWAFWPRPVQAVPVVAESPAATRSTPPPSAATTAAPSPTPTQTTPAGPVACEARYLKLGVSAYQKVKRDADATTFTVQLTSSQACVLAPDTVTVKVSSGSDLIWSTAHCNAGLPAKQQKVAAGKSVEFKVEWGVQRSAKGCTMSKDSLRAGTYVVTASLGEDGLSARKVLQLT